MTMYERLNFAKKRYDAWGVDVDKAMEALSKVKISIHCWQGDDVTGFENKAMLSGGIAVTGNYPGKARNAGELMADLDQALRFIPGRHKINLHAIYAIADEIPPRDKLEPSHFSEWVRYAQERGLGLDFNPTLFSHPMAAYGLTLSHPNLSVRRFWIDHCKATRRIAAYFGEALGQTSLHNIWIPDGYKDTPADRITPRRRLKESLDEIFAESYDPAFLLDAVESKLFGIGLESFTVGSHEFYMNYAARNNIACLLDNGHFHPTEKVSDKISTMLLFFDKLALHVTRSVRWDSDHVVMYDDELRETAQAIVACNALDRVVIGLDYFDATINRVAAWIVGVRNMQKALLHALLIPHDILSEMQEKGDFTGLLAIGEAIKAYPFGDVWEYFCEREDVPALDADWLAEVREYDDITKRRK